MAMRRLVIFTIATMTSIVACNAGGRVSTDPSEAIYCFIGNRFGLTPGSLERGWVCIPDVHQAPSMMAAVDESSSADITSSIQGHIDSKVLNDESIQR
jgi:hypothetical protein